MSDSFGARLRQQREERKIALRTIADSTKISVPLLEGLESDNVSRWPSGIFRKAFLRSYAQAIGLDPEPIVKEFEERFPDPLLVVPVQPEAAAAPEQPPSRQWRTWRLFELARRTAAEPEPKEGERKETERKDAQPSPVVLRLTINDPGAAFSRGKLLANIRKRSAAAAYDAGVPCIIALGLFPVLGHFWSPLGVAMLCYYFGGILILGNTPGVCLFAPNGTERDTV